MFYIPKRKIRRNQKWRRLCKLVRVTKRHDDVLYCVQLSPRARTIITHIDRLRRFDGDVPKPWKTVVNRADTTNRPSTDNQTGPAKSGSFSALMWFIVFPFAIRKTTDRFLFIHTSDLAFFRLAVCQTRLFRLDTRLSTVSDPRNKHVYIWKQNIYAATRLYQHLTLKLNGNWCFRSLLLRTNKRPLSFVINVPSVEYLSMLSRLCSRRW